jgi:hypothetical protein
MIQHAKITPCQAISGEKKTHWEEKKTLAKLASKLKKLLANSKIYSHLASWRVVISTPACFIAITTIIPMF